MERKLTLSSIILSLLSLLVTFLRQREMLYQETPEEFKATLRRGDAVPPSREADHVLVSDKNDFGRYTDQELGRLSENYQMINQF